LRTYIDVPYRQKDAAKQKGARYDMSSKRWYVPDGLDLADFKQWLPVELQNWFSPNSRQKTARGQQ
jgi:exodeoxyribonuclease VII large subunit